MFCHLYDETLVSYKIQYVNVRRVAFLNSLDLNLDFIYNNTTTELCDFLSELFDIIHRFLTVINRNYIEIKC